MRLNREQADTLGLGHLWPAGDAATVPTGRPERSRAARTGRTKLEEAFWDRVQEALAARVFERAWWEPIKLRLAGRTFYTPDCLIQWPEGDLAFCEVKGPFAREDSIVKLKTAAALYPCFGWALVTREGRAWTCRDVTDRGIAREAWVPDWLR